MKCKNCGCQLNPGDTSCPACGQVSNFESVINAGNGIKKVFIIIFVVMFIFPFFGIIFSFVTIGSSFNSFFENVEVNQQLGGDYTSVMDEYKFENVDWENVLREMLDGEDIESEEEFRDLIEENIEE